MYSVKSVRGGTGREDDKEEERRVEEEVRGTFDGGQ